MSSASSVRRLLRLSPHNLTSFWSLLGPGHMRALSSVSLSLARPRPASGVEAPRRGSQRVSFDMAPSRGARPTALRPTRPAPPSSQRAPPLLTGERLREPPPPTVFCSRAGASCRHADVPGRRALQRHGVPRTARRALPCQRALPCSWDGGPGGACAALLLKGSPQDSLAAVGRGTNSFEPKNSTAKRPLCCAPAMPLLLR